MRRPAPASCRPRHRSSSIERALIAAALVVVAAGLARAEEGVLDLPVVREGGGTASLRDVVGKGPALVAFWATYCPPCEAEVPALNGAAGRWGARGVRVLGVALESDRGRVDRARRSWGIDFETVRVAPNTDDLLERLFPSGLPAAAFVKGETVTRHNHILHDADIDRLIPELLGVKE
jgi:thiol-disulfide isomerase/thioredoxin